MSFWVWLKGFLKKVFSGTPNSSSTSTTDKSPQVIIKETKKKATIILDIANKLAARKSKNQEIKLDSLEILIKILKDGKFSAKARKIAELTFFMAEYLEKNPGNIKTTKRFLTYYLETTITILSKYMELPDQWRRLPEISKILNNIDSVLENVVLLFEKQKKHLLEETVMDLDVEIELLQRTIKMDLPQK